MDFSVLLKDLRDVAEKYQGKSTEPQVSTHAYVDMFTKILKRAQKVTEQYDDQITVLWVALNQLASIYKDLTAGSARDQLCKFIFGMCAKTVLNIQWAQLEEDSKVKKNFSTTVEDVHKILSQLGFHKFQLILDLMESHWTHPVLSKIMSGEEEDTDDCLEYIQKEDPDILKLRIEIMMKENCEEFALNLCNWSLKHPGLQNDLKIKEHQIFILYKQQEYGKMQEVCETIICHDGIKVMSHLAKTPTNQELCIRLAQVFLIQDWVKQERTCCTQELLKLWIHHQYLADKDEERFLDSIWTVAKVCRDTEQIGVLIDGVKKECGDMFIQLYSELCKYAINIDKGNMEREEVQKDREEYNKRRLAMSKTCVRMAFMLKEYDFRISRICGLTAFSLDPTTDNLNLVNKLYWTIKNVSAASQNSKINIATLYEIERLLGQMRPESLNPEYSWKQLIPVCKKYKLDYGNNMNEIPLKKEVKQEYIPSQTSSFEANKQVTPMPHMLHVVKSDKNVTKKIDTGQKRRRKPKNEVPKDIQQAHLAKLLGQKNLTQEEIEKVLRKEFPRNVTQEFSEAPSLDVKELDRTIDDLKKSIYLETQYRERIKNSISSLQQCKKRSDISDRAASGQHNQHVSRQEMFRQQQQIMHNKNAIQRQRSAPGGSRAQGPILHRQLSMGSPQPPNAHSHHRQQQMSPAFGGSPPPAHSTSPRLSSPTGFPSAMSPPSARPHSACPNILNSGKSGAFSQMHTSQNRSGTVSSQLCNKIKNELQQQSHQTKLMKNSRFNILRPPGNSKQECAKIAQQIAEMHERQRAERERAEKLEHARLQGQIDGVKAALNSRNIPSSSQISDLLSLTFQGNKGQTDGQKNVPSLQGADISQGKNYLKKKIERSASVSSTQNFASPEPVRRSSASMQSPNATSSGNHPYSSLNQSSTSSNNPSPSNRSHSTGRIPDVNHVTSSKESNSSVLVPGEQGWDPSRGIMKQKYYYKPPKDGSGNVNMGDSPLTMKPVYSMIVPKELTNPNRKEDLVKTVTNMMKKFPKGMHSKQEPLTSSSQTAVSAPTVVRIQSQNQTSSNQILNTDMVSQQIQNNLSSQQGLTSQISMQNNPSILDNQSSFQPVSSQSVAQTFLEDGLLNLNTLAAASVSVLGQNSSQQQLVGSLQLPQPVQQHHQQQQHQQQQQQMFGTPVVESQPMFSPMQSVQQVVQQQPETILATPLYTMPTTVIPEPVFSPQLASIQPQVDLGMQQPVMQQVIAVQNQPIAMNNTQPFVSVMSQQPAYQVATVEQVIYSGMSQSMTAGMSSSMSGGMTYVTGNGTDNIMDGITQSIAGGISHPVSDAMIQPRMSNPVETSPPAVRPIASKQFLAAPELSPALVQQILSSLKKGGAKSNPSKSQEGKQTTSKGQKQHSPVISRTQSSVSETQMLVNRNDPAGSINEARQKILELRKQFGHTAASQPDLPELSKVSPNKPVPTSFSNTVVTPRKTGGLLQRLMSDDQEVNKINSDVKNLPTFLSSSQSNGNITNKTVPTVPIPVVPELVDLGAKEFQLDTILALDNESSITSGNTLQNDQFSHANLATGGTSEANGTPSLVSQTETRLKVEQENTSHVKGLQQSEQSAAAVITDSACSVNLQNSQDDKHQDQPSHCQSTYFNANRLGKERENRDVKIQLASSEQMKPTVNSQQKMQTVCVSCDLKFPSEQHLLDHKKISNCESKWQCAYCKMTFKCSEILKTHEKNYCLKAPSTMVKCCICGVYFQSHEQLKGHLNPKTCSQNVHKDRSEFVEDIVCGICKRKFDSMNLIKEHVKAGCMKKDNNFSKERNLHNFNFSVVYRCTICNFMNLNENIVSKHVEKCKAINSTAELTEIYECNMCEETFCDKEDACRHVSRQCPKLKVTNSQRQVQDVYQKLKDGNISKVRSGDSEKMVELKSNMQTAKEKVLADGNEREEKGGGRTVLTKEVRKKDKKDTSIKHSKNGSNVQKMKCEDIITECNVPNISVEKASKGRVKVTTAESRKADSPIGTISDKVKLEDKTSTSDEIKTKDHGSIETEVASSEDKIELATQLQKVQRISAENQFFAEFNEMEKRKQAIRMKKQKELEKQKELLEKKEKQLALEKQKKIQEQLEEKEKQKLINEKEEREKHDFEKEKKKYVNSILGTSTLGEKMKESIEKEKKLKKTKREKVTDGTIKGLDTSGHEQMGTKQLKSESIDEVVVENKISESSRDESQQKTEYVANKKKRKKEDDRDSESEIHPDEDKVLNEHIETSERRKRKRQRDVLKTENIECTQRKTNKKQRSPQDIRKIRGLRAKRLIKKKKYYMDEMEPIHRDKFRKEEEQEERSQNIIHGMKNKRLINVKTEIIGRDMEAVHREKHKKEVEKDRSPKVENLIKSRDNKNVDKRDHTNQTKDTKQIYKHLCKFCGLQNKIKSDKNLDIIYHYVQTHKLGFRQINYKYFCNFCNKQFPSTQTIQVKDHVCHNHWEGVLGRVAGGKYDTKVESTTMNKSLSPAKTRYSLRVPVRTPVKSNISKKHLRAVALREKCAEKLRRIALTRKNTIIDYTDIDEDSSIPCSSNHSTDTESLSREERIADVTAKIASISHGKMGKDTDLGAKIKDGRRIAPRLARQMVKDSCIKGNKARPFEDVKKPSDIDDSSDMQVVTRSRSSSASSSRSSLIASAKKRKAAIAISARGSSKSRQKLSEGGAKLHTRSGRVVKRPEMDYDKLTESSGLGSGEDNSELEDSDIRKRKSTRIRRLSEKGKSIRGATTDTDESSTEEVKRRVTRRSLSKGQKENDDNITDSQNLDGEKNVTSSKRIRTGQSPVSRLNNELVELRSLKKKILGKGRERVVKVERVITRQISKNEDESDSETESNYTDIEHTVKMLGLKMTQNAAVRSAESDSESTSEEDGGRDRKYRLRKRHLNKKYRDPESSEEEETNMKGKFTLKGVDDSDFEPSEECNNPFEDYLKTEKGSNIKVMGRRSLRSDSFNSGEHEEEAIAKNKNPKTVLIGPEEDDDLNVDYGLCEKNPDFYSDSPVNELSSEDPGRNSEEHEDNSKIRDEDESCIQDRDEIIGSKTRTVLVSPEDEFAGLESSPTKSHGREKNVDSEIISESVSEVDTEVESKTLPATVMDEDEFVFLKNDQIEDASNVGTNENQLNSSTCSFSKAAFDSEFIKYAKTENREEDTDSDSDFQEKIERLSKKNEGRIEKDPVQQKLKIEIPLLDEDVPVLPPRDCFIDGEESLKAPFINSDISEERNKSKSVNVETLGNSLEECDTTTGSGRPKSREKSKTKILKSARVVIEDISVVRKALEIENAEKKLIEECEASSCSVRIDRLSKEEIEKHLPSPSNVVENKEVEIILIQDSDEENVDTKAEIKRTNRKENSQKKGQNNALNEKSSGSEQKSVIGTEEQYETLIQDIVLDGSFIDQLLVSENLTVNEVIPGQPDKGEDASNLESTGCVQIVVENSNNLQDSVLAVDAQCDTSADADADTSADVVLGSNNVIILIDDNGAENVKSRRPNDTKNMKEIEEDVWIENAESYAETTKNPENDENKIFKYAVVKSDDIETINKLDISDILGLSKGECTVVASSLNDASESKQNEITSERYEIADNLCDKNNQKVSEIIETAEKSEIMTKDKADSSVSHIENKQSEESSLQLYAAADNVTEDVKYIQDTVKSDTEKGVVSEITDKAEKSEIMTKDKADSPVSHIENKQSEKSSLQLTAAADDVTEDVENIQETVNPDTEKGVVSEITDKTEQFEIMMKDKADSPVSHIENKQSEESSLQLTGAADNVTENVENIQDTVYPDSEKGVVNEIIEKAEKLENVMKDKADSLVSKQIPSNVCIQQELDHHVSTSVEAEKGVNGNEQAGNNEVTLQDVNNYKDTNITYPLSNITDLNTKPESDDNENNDTPKDMQSEKNTGVDAETKFSNNVETNVGLGDSEKGHNKITTDDQAQNEKSQKVETEKDAEDEIERQTAENSDQAPVEEAVLIGIINNDHNNSTVPAETLEETSLLDIKEPLAEKAGVQSDFQTEDIIKHGNEKQINENRQNIETTNRKVSSGKEETGELLAVSDLTNSKYSFMEKDNVCDSSTDSSVFLQKTQKEETDLDKDRKDSFLDVSQEDGHSKIETYGGSLIESSAENFHPMEMDHEIENCDHLEENNSKSEEDFKIVSKSVNETASESVASPVEKCNQEVDVIEEADDNSEKDLTSAEVKMEKDKVCDTSTESFVVLRKTLSEETNDDKDSVLDVSTEHGHSKIETNDDISSESSAENVIAIETDHELENSDHLEENSRKSETPDGTLIESSTENVLPTMNNDEIENSDHLGENGSKSKTNDDTVTASSAENVLATDSDHEIEYSNHLEENSSKSETNDVSITEPSPGNVLSKETDHEIENSDHLEKNNCKSEEVNETAVESVTPPVEKCNQEVDVLEESEDDSEKDLTSVEVKIKGSVCDTSTESFVVLRKTQKEETDEDKDGKDSVLDVSPEHRHSKIETKDDILSESSAESVLATKTDHEIEYSNHSEENSRKSETDDDTVIESSAENVFVTETDPEIENTDYIEESSSKSESNDNILIESSAENVLGLETDHEREYSDLSEENSRKSETHNDTVIEPSAENVHAPETDHEIENSDHLEENSSKSETIDDIVIESSAENVLATETDHEIEYSDPLEENNRKSETNDVFLAESSPKNVLSKETDHEIENSDHLEENNSKSETHDETVIESSAGNVLATESDHEIDNSDHLEENSSKSETIDDTVIESSAENVLATETDYEIENSDHLEENSSKSETIDDTVIESSAENVLATETDYEIENSDHLEENYSKSESNDNTVNESSAENTLATETDHEIENSDHLEENSSKSESYDNALIESSAGNILPMKTDHEIENADYVGENSSKSEEASESVNETAEESVTLSVEKCNQEVDVIKEAEDDSERDLTSAEVKTENKDFLCFSGNMQEENLASVLQPTANLDVPDKSEVCNEVDMVDEEIDKDEKRNNDSASSNSSLLAIQSYSDSDEDDLQNVIEEIKTTRNTESTTCIEELTQSDKQQKLESVTNTVDVNVEELQIGEEESVETEQLQNEKSLKPDITETKNTPELDFAPLCVESSHVDLVETREKISNIEKFDNSAVVFEEKDVHETNCVISEKMPPSVQSSVVSFDDNEVENVCPLQVIKESESIKEIPEYESKTVVDADSCTELKENDRESANDSNSVVNLDEVDINELKSAAGSGSDRTVEQLRNSSSGTETNINLLDIVQTEHPVISVNKQNEIHSTLEERMMPENEVNDHIQHVGEVDEEKEKDLENTAKCSDINVEVADSGKEMDSCSQLSVKNEKNFQELSSSDQIENKILMLDDADSNVTGSICITNSETLQANMDAADAQQTDKEQMLKCKVTDPDDVLKPDMFEGDLSEEPEGKSEHDVNDSSKDDNEVAKSDSDFSEDNVPSCIQEEENILTDLMVQKTFETEKESVDQLKVEFEQLKNDEGSDLDAGPENSWIVVDECSGSSDNDQNIEIESKNPMLKTLRQVSVSSSSDISLISCPEYETEHSEESNDKRENLIESTSTENADCAITDEVRDSENDLTSQEESKPECPNDLEQKQVESIAELPEEIPAANEKPILETEYSANSSNPLEIARDNMVSENVMKEAKVDVSTGKINEVDHDESNISSFCINEDLETESSVVTVHAETSQVIVVEGSSEDLSIESCRVTVNSGMNKGILVEGIKVPEITSTNDSDSSKNVLEATLDNVNTASDDLCQVNQEKTEVKLLDNIDKIQEPELQENHAHEISSASQKDGEVSDKNLECDEIERKIENPRKADSDSFGINEMEANDLSIESQEISHVKKNLDEVALNDTKSAGEGISNAKELINSVRKTRRQSVEQSEQTESRPNSKRQRTKSFENVEEEKGLRNTRWSRSRSKELDSKDRNHLSSRRDKIIVEHKETSNDEKDLIEKEKAASIKIPVDNNGGNSVSVKQAVNIIHTREKKSEVSKNVSETNITIDQDTKSKVSKNVSETNITIDQETKSKVSKNVSETNITIDQVTTKNETDKGQNITLDDKETTSSEEMIESEEDPTLDKWVKEIISKETEEKREVFEMPSPRRKGMIVGATCLHKKPENPFVDTRSFKKDGSPRKEVNVGNQTGTRKAYEEKDEIKVNLNKKLQCLQGSERKIVAQSERLRERSTRVDMSEERVQKDLKSKAIQSDTNQTSGGSRTKISSKLSIKKDQREKNQNKNNVEVGTKDKTSANTHRETKVEQVCHKGKDVSKKTDCNKTLNTSPVIVQHTDSKNRKNDDRKSGDKPKPTENSTKTELVKAEVKQNLTSSSKFHLKQNSEILVEKCTGDKVTREGNGNEELQREDETDEEFRRRLETVRCARRKSAITPYESDFNFEENEKTFKVTDTKAFSTSFWPSESENNLENFDTASLFSSSSGSSAHTGGVKDGKLNVIARCARDFGKDELVKHKVIQLSRPNVVPVFTCSSPEKTTVSTMAVKIVKTMGRSVVNTVPSPVKYTRQQCSTPVISTKIKVLDKNVLSNTPLPARIVKVTAFKSLPKVPKSVTITPTNIDTTLKKLTKQGNISKKAQAVKSVHGSSMQREKTKKLNEVRKGDNNTQQSIAGKADEIPQQEGFEPTAETLSNKVKALRALHKSDKPFKWENSPSPPKNLRSQRKGSENLAGDPNKESISAEQELKNKPETNNKSIRAEQEPKSKPETNEESISTEQEPKNKPETRKTREKTLKHAATQKNMRENRKKGLEETSKKGRDSKDISSKKQIVVEESKKRQREPDTTEQNVNLRTRSRSGSKDKTKFTEEKNLKQKQEVTRNNKKQIQDKLETENSTAKASANSLRTETRNISVKSKKSSMKLRHCSDESEKETAKDTELNAEIETSEKVTEVKTRVQKRKSEVENSAKEPELNAEIESEKSKEVKTRVQKRKSEVENVKEPKQTSGEEPAEKVCKLDGTSNSPEKSEEPKCAHKLNIPGCDHCKARQSENSKFGKEPVRPAVRQIIHKGRVFEIQRGCVTETDIQDFTTKPRSEVNETTSTSSEDQMKKRSRRVNERRKRAHSPEEIVDKNMKDKGTEFGMQDINKYISQTLRDIKKQRDGNSNTKWTVRQKKSTKEAFPYYFKKANSKL